VRALAQQAEEILDTAVRGDTRGSDLVILLDRQGGIRMLDPLGWTLSALKAEFGASTMFKIERSAGATSVEGWAGLERCIVERQCDLSPAPTPLTPTVRHPIRLQAPPLLIAESSRRAPAIWNC
jgi:hypothetical protein